MLVDGSIPSIFPRTCTSDKQEKRKSVTAKLNQQRVGFYIF